MFFQKVLKGIPDLSPSEAASIVKYEGIRCNWWRRVDPLPTAEITDRLTEANLLAHLNRYGESLPPTEPLVASHQAKTYGDITPFISTTAGAVQRAAFRRTNVIFPPLLTALRFATREFKTSGCVFHLYVITLGKQSIPLPQFAEEVRELHTYTQFLPFQREGEITAKIDIPPVQIHKAELYDGPASRMALRRGDLPVPTQIVSNSVYSPPELYSNIRDML